VYRLARQHDPPLLFTGQSCLLQLVARPQISRLYPRSSSLVGLLPRKENASQTDTRVQTHVSGRHLSDYIRISSWRNVCFWFGCVLWADCALWFGCLPSHCFTVLKRFAKTVIHSCILIVNYFINDIVCRVIFLTLCDKLTMCLFSTLFLHFYNKTLFDGYYFWHCLTFCLFLTLFDILFIFDIVWHFVYFWHCLTFFFFLTFFDSKTLFDGYYFYLSWCMMYLHVFIVC